MNRGRCEQQEIEERPREKRRLPGRGRDGHDERGEVQRQRELARPCRAAMPAYRARAPFPVEEILLRERTQTGARAIADPDVGIEIDAAPEPAQAAIELRVL